MTKKADKTKLDKEFEQLLNNGLAFEKDKSYYGFIDGQETMLGSSKAEVFDTLDAMQADGKSLEIRSEVATHNESDDEPDSLQTALADDIDQIESTESEDDLWAEILGTISDLAPDNADGDFVVLIDGVNALRFTDRTLPANHPVRNCPLVFRWNRREQNVNNGSTIRNNGWTVLPKALAKRLKISTLRDDTPDQDFFTVKGLVLVTAKKDQFLRKKMKQNYRYKLAAAYEMEQRQESAKDAAIRSKTDIEAAAALYAEDFNSVIEQAAQTGHIQSNMKISPKELMQKLMDSDDANLAEVAGQIDSALDNGNLTNVIGNGQPLNETDI
jgi:hypothetical protein